MESLRFRADDGVELEGELRRPAGAARGSAVVCHAHPGHGGSKDHPLLWAIRNELARRGLAVLAFNFRGVMESDGSYGGGIDEAGDVRGAVGRVRREAPGRTIVVGWSFGAAVALRDAVVDRDVAALALVGLPVEPGDVEIPPIPGRPELRRLAIPLLVLSGARDRYAPEPALRAIAGLIPRSEVVIVPEGDHFLRRREAEAAGIIGGFAEAALGLASGHA
jgi:uncharacterized protein